MCTAKKKKKISKNIIVYLQKKKNVKEEIIFSLKLFML